MNGPTWLVDQVIYEIFPDRFAIGQPYDSTSKLAQPAYHRAVDYKCMDWSDRPKNPSMGKDFFGGDLKGITDRLDHLCNIGVTSLFLTPIFFAPSNHKYDATDFFKVDEQFGGEPALVSLLDVLHRRDMRLFMDISINHVSDIHPWFLQARDGQQPYPGFFSLREGDQYDCWRDFRQMPELNLSNRQLQDQLWLRPDSVLQKYLRLGLDGWRFDVANDTGHSVAGAIRQMMDQAFPDAAMIGEVTSFAGDWTVGANAYHGVMNYYFRSATLGWLGGDLDKDQMMTAVEEYYRGYGHQGSLQSWNILSSHDTPRLRTMLPDLEQRRLAILAQFTLPGVPFVFYGEEIGMEGGDDPDCRRPMVWEESKWDRDVLSFYRTIAEIRKQRAELRMGGLQRISTGHGPQSSMRNDGIAFLRFTDVPNEVSLVLLNNSAHPWHQRLMLPHSHLFDGLPMRNLLDFQAEPIRLGQGYVDLALGPRTGAIFVPDDTRYTNYRFYKGHMRDVDIGSNRV
jgi:alpha-glucosidase